MKYCLILVLLCGCTVVTHNRVFPKLTWYWSAEAKQQRADQEAYKKQFGTNQITK